MKKINYKHIVIVLTIICIALLIIMRNEPKEIYIKTIIISLAINILSSIVIIFMIDVKKENDSKKKIYERRATIYKSLISPIREYNNLIYNLYKATTEKKKIDLKYFDNSAVNFDKVFNNISLLDINKDGYKYNIYRRKSILWKEVIISEFLSYIKSLKDFYNINSQYIDNELSELLYKIISNEKTKDICNYMLNGVISTNIDDLLQILNLKEIFITTKQIEKNIEAYIDIDKLKVEKSSIMADNVSPGFASGMKNK